LLVVSCAACVPRPAQPPAAPPPAALPREADLVRALDARRRAIRSLRSVARTTYTTPTESQAVRQVILVARPDRLRLEVLSPFGVAFVLATSDGALAAYARDEATFYHGTASVENLARYTQVALPVDTAVDLLLSTPPVGESGSGVVSHEDGRVKLWQEDGRRVNVIWFGEALEPARFEQRDEDGTVLVRATFTDFTQVDRLRLPTRLALEIPPARQRIDIALREPEVNPALPDSVFALAMPQGSKVVDLDRVFR
jgi:outer membrane lipoprotein-sorting protein